MQQTLELNYYLLPRTPTPGPSLLIATLRDKWVEWYTSPGKRREQTSSSRVTDFKLPVSQRKNSRPGAKRKDNCILDHCFTKERSEF